MPFHLRSLLWLRCRRLLSGLSHMRQWCFGLKRVISVLAFDLMRYCVFFRGMAGFWLHCRVGSYLLLAHCWLFKPVLLLSELRFLRWRTLVSYSKHQGLGSRKCGSSLIYFDCCLSSVVLSNWTCVTGRGLPPCFIRLGSWAGFVILVICVSFKLALICFGVWWFKRFGSTWSWALYLVGDYWAFARPGLRPGDRLGPL